MDGTELRVLPYEAIDLGKHDMRFLNKPLHFRQNGKWGLLDPHARELIPPLSDKPLERGEDLYLTSSGSYVGLAAPFRGHVLQSVYKKIQACPFRHGSNLGFDGKPGPEFYQGIYCIQDDHDQWGM